MKADKIYLVGFMAAGKTTLARALAKRLEWEALDIDELIEARERMTVSDIFARFGEPHFRAIEREMLRTDAGSSLARADLILLHRDRHRRSQRRSCRRHKRRNGAAFLAW